MLRSPVNTELDLEGFVGPDVKNSISRNDEFEFFGELRFFSFCVFFCSALLVTLFLLD